MKTKLIASLLSLLIAFVLLNDWWCPSVSDVGFQVLKLRAAIKPTSKGIVAADELDQIVRRLPWNITWFVVTRQIEIKTVGEKGSGAIVWLQVSGRWYGLDESGALFPFEMKRQQQKMPSAVNKLTND